MPSRMPIIPRTWFDQIQYTVVRWTVGSINCRSTNCRFDKLSFRWTVISINCRFDKLSRHGSPYTTLPSLVRHKFMPCLHTSDIPSVDLWHSGVSWLRKKTRTSTNNKFIALINVCLQMYILLISSAVSASNWRNLLCAEVQLCLFWLMMQCDNFSWRVNNLRLSKTSLGPNQMKIADLRKTRLALNLPDILCDITYRYDSVDAAANSPPPRVTSELMQKNCRKSVDLWRDEV